MAILTDCLSLPPQTHIVLVLRALFNRRLWWLWSCLKVTNWFIRFVILTFWMVLWCWAAFLFILIIKFILTGNSSIWCISYGGLWLRGEWGRWLLTLASDALRFLFFGRYLLLGKSGLVPSSLLSYYPLRFHLFFMRDHLQWVRSAALFSIFLSCRWWLRLLLLFIMRSIFLIGWLSLQILSFHHLISGP